MNKKVFILSIIYFLILVCLYNVNERIYNKKVNEIKELKSKLEQLNFDNERLRYELNKIKEQVKQEKLSRGNVDRGRIFEITAYTHTGYKTASGVWPRVNRTIAVDPEIIPLGKIVYIEGIGYRIAEDTGKLIKGNKIDLFLNAENECWKFGVQRRKVYVVR